jgi:glycosyltransferase involved in cell wall biosynthesis
MTSRPLTFRKPYGYVDCCKDGVLYGWAWNPADPSRRLNIDVFYDGLFLGQYSASYFRTDLLTNKIGDGYHAFQARIGNGAQIDNLDHVDALIAFPERVALRIAGKRSRTQFLKPKTIATYLRGAFSPLLVRISEKDTNGDLLLEPNITDSRRIYELLFDEAPVDDLPPVHCQKLCAYTNYVRCRFGLNEIYDVSFSEAQYSEFLRWYLENYCADQMDQRAPLSFSEIAHLNQPITDEALGVDITRAASFFVKSRFRFSPRDNINLQMQVAYWWAIEQSRVFFVEDCLVPPKFTDLLQSTPGQNTEFPLSHFMKIFISRNSILRRLSLRTASERQMIYYIIMLYALTIPHLLSYCPNRWIQTLLHNDDNNNSIFDVITIEIFRDISEIDGRKYCKYMEQNGFNMQTLRFNNFTAEGNRVWSAALLRPAERQVDIQMIAPFRRTLGLGESARLLAKMISNRGYKINLVDYDLKNQSPIAPGGTFGSYCPARVNVLHLNPETIPTAVAYLPDVFSGAYNIGFCYWELDFPADCQLLGLKIPNEIWVASAFVADVFRPFCTSVFMAGMTCDFGEWGRQGRDRSVLRKYGILDSEYVFITVSDALSRVQRKNPMGAVRAFLRAFPHDASKRLIIKTHNRPLIEANDQNKSWDALAEIANLDKRIVFIDETLSRETYRSLIAGSDCFVSLHRSEGFGLDLLYALSCGVQLLATKYSGNMEFCNSETAWLVNYTNKYVGKFEYAFVEPGHKWAEPNYEEAASAMRDMVGDEKKRSRLAANARELIEERFSMEHVSDRIDRRLQEILESRT